MSVVVLLYSVGCQSTIVVATYHQKLSISKETELGNPGSVLLMLYLSADCRANLGNVTAASMGYSVARAVQTDLY